jgi:hypothetical protein
VSVGDMTWHSVVFSLLATLFAVIGVWREAK